jgi:hypothetical protein
LGLPSPAATELGVLVRWLLVGADVGWTLFVSDRKGAATRRIRKERIIRE